ncbi:MAG: hypothetical protein ACO31D_06605 [Ilumatobacteraceae bacterium]
MTRILVIDDAHGHGAVDAHSRDTVNDGSTLVVSWNTFSRVTLTSGSRVVHLGDQLHDQEDTLQRALLHWLGALAEKHTADSSSLPYVFPNLHSWWLLKVSEKNYATSPEFTTLLKLSLLRTICENEAASRCDYAGADRNLEWVLHHFARESGLATNARADALPVAFGERLEVAQAILHFLRVFGIALVNLLRQTKRTAQSTPAVAPKNTTTPATSSAVDDRSPLGFVGYLLPLPGGERAHSPYWGSLRQNLIPNRTSLWLYHRSDEVSWRDGRAFCAQNESDRESHRLIDDFITIRAAVRSIGTYVRFCRAHKRLVLDVARTTSAFGGLAAQQLFRAALRDSLTGSHAVWAAVHAHTYQSLVHDCDVKRWFFLWENKAFEQSLISAAQRRGDVETIGYSHSVVRKQDNRYYNELHFVPVVGGRSRPTASRYAVNGALPIRNIQLVAPPAAPLCEVEALRYLSLTTREKVTGDAVLVVGDISATESERLVVATVAALPDSYKSRVVLFKPHPGNLSQMDMARALGCEVSTEPLASLAPLVSFAVVGNAGAASLDLTMLGVPVITLLDAHTTNLSPLAGMHGALFARDVADLRQFAQNARLGAGDISSVMTRTQPPSRWLALLSGSQ